jgi:hypothetical protein
MTKDDIIKWDDEKMTVEITINDWLTRLREEFDEFSE